MNTALKLIPLAAAALAAACATTVVDPDVTRVRAELTTLRADPQLGSRAPLAMHDAEDAVRSAEAASSASVADRKHLVYVADRKVSTARARAEALVAQDEMRTLADARDQILLRSREREAALARNDAATQRALAAQALDSARRQGDDAARARADAAAAQHQADLAMMEANEYKQQLSDLQAKQTDRGMVVTLGDVLFASGKADLKAGNQARLDKLAAFLQKYPDKSVIIEGHTDSVGGEEYNERLSQRRAESVKQYLVANGVPSSRIQAVGKGKAAPVASNSDAAGRQQNRRVEVVIQSVSS